MTLDFLVVGSGMMGQIVPGNIRHAGGEVTALLAHSKESAEKYLQTQRLPRLTKVGTFDEYSSFLEGTDCNAVAILTPNYMHAGMAIEAARAGKHLFIEKPMATSVADAQEVFHEVSKSGVAAEVNSQYRHHELLSENLRTLIETEEFGKPLHLTMNYFQDWQLDPTTDIGWRPVVAVAGKGKLVGDLGAHVVHTTAYLFDGEFIEFQGQTYNLHPVRYKLKNASAGTFSGSALPSPDEQPNLYEQMDMLSKRYSGDDYATAEFTLQTAKGVIVPGRFELSQVTKGHANDFTIDVQFENARVYWSQEHPNQLNITKDGDVHVLERSSAPSMTGRPGGHPQGYDHGILQALCNIMDVVESGDPEKIQSYSMQNLSHALQSVKLIEKWMQNPILPYQEK